MPLAMVCEEILDTAKSNIGVDYISVGALTHSARAVDFSLELVGGSLPWLLPSVSESATTDP